ncbi:poly(A) polymerase [Thioalkalivibrio sp. K90mix]|uniref:polynucleotide adenylyltransferase PcnB n=1 Tax=Thioalkalivibrio sp. (strain K90mix) TaxID=396595 RepID=UPI00019598BF|nr:polynucleotide adenylyltransferase PcnB [Thioalkalivibrio sp. K90mix]ADC72537.1 poly(A) polymerase [Thioalkalivibrio sp. K90mix]
MTQADPATPSAAIPEPRVYSREEHGISRAAIDDNALKVLYRLRDAGYRACLVGGGVRDLLLGREPKDFDIATDATPDQVRGLFRNCRLIGRRFRLAHVLFGREVIEVATFRAPHDEDDDNDGQVALSEEGRILRDNRYGTIEQDAVRRDFSVNALYYDIDDFSVLDYTGGVEDLREGVLRLIGDDVETRLREDPVRMLRAVRFSAKLGLRIAPEVEAGIRELAGLMQTVAPARLFDEVIKLFHSGAAVTCLDELERFGLFAPMFPEAAECFADPDVGAERRQFLVESLLNTDKRINEELGVNPAFLYAAILWAPVQVAATRRIEDGEQEIPAWQQAMAEVLDRQVKTVSIPKRFSLIVREIWELQARLERARGGRALRLLTHPRFRAGYDFLCLRARAGDADPELCRWWTEFQEKDEGEQKKMAGGGGKGKGRARRGGRRRKRRRTGDGEAGSSNDGGDAA